MIQKASILCALLLCLGLSTAFSQSNDTTTADTLTAVEAYGQLSVNGTNVVDSAGNPVQLQGMSLFWSNWTNYYTYGAVEEIQKNWCANIVRAAMGVDASGGYLDDSASNVNKVETVVDAAIDLGIYVIIDWHSHNAHNQEAAASRFFKYMAKKYGDKPNVIYEIYNEPEQVSWSNTIKPYCNTVIDSIRKYDSDNIIVCGTPNWCQYVDEAANDPITGENNIAYSQHYYAAGNADSQWDDIHQQGGRDRAIQAMNEGIALFVTEYGNVESDGDGPIDSSEAKKWYNFLNKNNISYCNWSLHDKEESASALEPGASTSGGWTSSDITSSGKFVKNHLTNNCPEYVTGIFDYSSNSKEINVYPNPAGNVVKLKGFKPGETPQWKLYNNLGEPIKEGTAQEIDLSDTEPGVYILKTKTESHKICVQ